MKGFETPAPANDNNDIYGKFEIVGSEWQRHCAEVAGLSQELATLAEQAKHESGGKAQMARTIEMIQLALELQETLSQPRQHVGLTER